MKILLTIIFLSANLTFASINDFTFSLYKNISQKKGNIFFSPYGIYMALAMTANGAKSETLNEMLSVLGEKNINDLNNSIFMHDSKNLKLANSLWGNTSYVYNENFLEIIRKTYNSELNSLDFKNDPENARLVINKWVEEKTEKKIVDLLTPGAIDSGTSLVLANAIYFKDEWSEGFEVEDTYEDTFHSEQAKKMKFMRNQKKYGYFENEDIKLVELLYKNSNISMILILPSDDKKDISNVEKIISAKSFNEWLSKINNEDVILKIPKFKFEQSLSLKQNLIDLGMTIPFNAIADFSLITSDTKLAISKVIHKAVIEVEEKGTEASAATAVVMMKSMSLLKNPKVFFADGPFLFFIIDKSKNDILFIGKLME